MEGNSSTGFIVVHLGAGYHSKAKTREYKKLTRRACKLGRELCKDGHLASYIACEVVSLLETSDLTNAGYGSNLTQSENVECDASLMDSDSKFAAVGCIENIKNPVKVAYDLLKCQNENNCNLVPPILLVGQGAQKWAIDRGFSTIASKDMISESALRTYHESRKKVDELSRCHHYAVGCKRKNNNQQVLNHVSAESVCRTEVLRTHNDIGSMMDTIGAICIDCFGNVCAAVSSGGVILKHPGRVGHAACYGCGCFVAKRELDTKHIICASSASGCGEHLIKTSLAKSCVDTLLADVNEHRVRNKSLNSRRVSVEDDYGIPEEVHGFGTAVCDHANLDGESPCSKRCHLSTLSTRNSEKSSNMHNFKNCTVEVPNLLDDGFLQAGVLRAIDKKIAGCINIRLIKQLYYTSDGAIVDSAAAEGCSSEWGCASDTSQRATYSVDLIVTSTAQTFCVGFMSIKDSKSRFLLLEMPDVERVGKASVTQEFHIDL